MTSNTMVFCRGCGTMYVAEALGGGNDASTRVGGFQFAGPECKGCKGLDYQVLTPRKSNNAPYRQPNFRQPYRSEDRDNRQSF
jgi:hypothetical protein